MGQNIEPAGHGERPVISRRTLLKGAAGGAGVLAISSMGVGGAGALLAPRSVGAARKLSGTLTVWHYFSVPSQVKVMTDFAKLMEKTYPGVSVQNVFVPYDDMDEKLIAAAGAQAGPDVAVVNGGDTTQIAEGGALLPMNDYWSSYTDRKEFPESVLHTYGSKIYSVQGYVNLLGLWYNADLLSRLKVDVPTTFGEFTSAMEQVLKASSSTIPLTLCGLPNSQGEWQAYPWLTGYGFDYKSPSTSALTKGFSLISDWVNAGYVSREAVTYDQTIPFTRFLVGNVAFSENGNWQLATAKAGAKFRYGIAPLPSGPDGSQIYLGGEGVGIGRYSKNPDLAWAYLKTTYLSKTGQLIPLQDVGSIPSRLDVGDNPEIKNNKLLKPFAAELAKRGAAYPPLIYPASIVNQELVVGQQWSAVIGGASPSAAARTAITGIEAARRKG